MPEDKTISFGIICFSKKIATARNRNPAAELMSMVDLRGKPL